MKITTKKGVITVEWRKKEYNPRHIWIPFDREPYHWAWVDDKFAGIAKRFCRDMKYCGQRICKGFCDEDLRSIHDWFLEIVPAMLEQYKNTRNGSPNVLGENHPNEKGFIVNETCHKEWTEILDKMIFLFREADESTCQKKNPYEEEHSKAFHEFTQKYGLFGEQLETQEEKEESRRTGGYVVHFMSELPEYAEIDEKYRAAEKELSEYRNQCKDEAFKLFSEWFFHLWD